LLNAVFFWDVAVVAVKLQPALEALVVILQQAVVVLVDDGDVLPCDGAGDVYNNTSYDFYNNIFFVEPVKKLLFQGKQQRSIIRFSISYCISFIWLRKKTNCL
jgi:hypothetical protein